MARGVQSGGRDVTAMEMTKWFDTKLPLPRARIRGRDRRSAVFLEAGGRVPGSEGAGYPHQACTDRPVTFLLLGKARTARFDGSRCSTRCCRSTRRCCRDSRRPARPGCSWDEPESGARPHPAERAAFVRAYRFLAERVPKLKILVATYFAGLDDNLSTALELPWPGCTSIWSARPGEGRFDALLQAWPAGGGRKGRCCRSV